MINAIGTYIGSFKRTFDGDSVQELSNTVQFINGIPSGTTWNDSKGDYIAPIDHQWEGGCYDFDGTNDYVDIPSTGSLSAFTVSAWIKTTGNLINIVSGSNAAAYINIYNNKLAYYDGVTWRYGITIMNDGNWHHAVFVFDSGNMQLWSDGVKEYDNDEGTYSSGDISVIGKFISEIRQWSGGMFDVRIFNKALTSSEVTDIYNHKSVTTANLVAHYKMDETAGTTSFDSSGNGNHGTITNATLSTFHATQNEYSFKNELGYTKSDGSTWYKNDDSTGLIPIDVDIPRDESNTSKSVTYLSNGAQADLQYSGRVKYDAQLVESHCGTFDGVNDYVDTGYDPLSTLSSGFTFMTYYKVPASSTNDNELLGRSGVTQIRHRANTSVFDVNLGGHTDGVHAWRNISFPYSEGDIVLIKIIWDGSDLEVFYDGVSQGTKALSGPTFGSSGNIWLGRRYDNAGKLSGGLFDTSFFNSSDTLEFQYPFSEGAGTTIYDISGNANHGTATNITEATFWGSTQDKFHYNLTKGFSLYEHASNDDIRVPYGDDGNPLSITAPSGYTKTSDKPTGAYHNASETKIKQHKAPALLNADETDDFWFNSSDVAQAKSYSDIIENVNTGNRLMADVSTANQKKNLTMFDPALVGPDLADVTEFLNHS